MKGTGGCSLTIWGEEEGVKTGLTALSGWSVLSKKKLELLEEAVSTGIGGRLLSRSSYIL